jgi:CBS domain-containing protein
MTATGTTIQPPNGSYLTPRYEKALVSDAMRIGIFTCPPETSLRDVAQMMATHHIHCVVVTDIAARGSGARSWGVLSDLELARAAGPDAADRTASETAATELVTVAADEALSRATQLMAEHDTSHLVVVQSTTGKPVGVLSTLDVAGVLAWGEA